MSTLLNWLLQYRSLPLYCLIAFAFYGVAIFIYACVILIENDRLEEKLSREREKSEGLIRHIEQENEWR